MGILNTYPIGTWVLFTGTKGEPEADIGQIILSGKGEMIVKWDKLSNTVPYTMDDLKMAYFKVLGNSQLAEVLYG